MANLKLYIIRHGATIWNKEALYTGQTDVPLNEEGYRQAERISHHLAGEGLRAVYTSALCRAVATAQIIAQPHAIAPQVLPGLLEVNFGAWEGHPYTYIREHYAEALHRWSTDPVNFRIPGGEALTDIRDRVNTALELILQANPEGSVAAVAHSGSIRMLFCLLLKMDLTAFWRIMQFNGAVNLVEFRNGIPTVLSVNNTSHLLD